MKTGKYKTTFLGTEYPVYYITEAKEAKEYLDRLQNQDQERFAIDTETYALPQFKTISSAALSPHLSKVRLLQLFTGRSAVVFDIAKINRDTIFTSFLETGKFIGHNAIFDLQFFYNQFKVKTCEIGCTYLVAKLLFHALKPTDEGLSASLGNLVNQVFKTELIKEMGISDWSEPELTWEQIEYSALDAISTYFLAEKLAPKLKKFGLERIYKLYKDSQHPIAKLQLNGIKFDADSHRDLIVDWRAKLYDAKKRVLKLTGLEKISSVTLGGYLEKSLPPETLSAWPRTETGKMATDAHVFADFDYLDIVKPFSEYQKLETLCTSFGSRIISQINPHTNRLHAQYKLAGARTGRLSCSTPNLQQLPRDTAVRKSFIADTGHVFVCADYSQIELRVGAELSRDATMLKAYREGIDLHRLTASKIMKKGIDEVSKEDRQKAKAFNFGLMFGLGARKFSHYAKKSYGAEVSQDEANEGVKAFRETYSGYREWQTLQASMASEKGFVSTPTGKRRCLDATNCYGASMNTPIQGGAAECMLSSLCILQNVIDRDRWDFKIVNCVHDEVSLEVPEKLADKAKVILETSMMRGFLNVFPKGITRGLVESHVGKNWAEAKG